MTAHSWPSSVMRIMVGVGCWYCGSPGAVLSVLTVEADSTATLVWAEGTAFLLARTANEQITVKTSPTPITMPISKFALYAIFRFGTGSPQFPQNSAVGDSSWPHFLQWFIVYSFKFLRNFNADVNKERKSFM